MDDQYALTGLQLLYADTDTIKNYCRTNIVARNICNNVDFWLEKFDNDNIPIIGLTITDRTTGNDYMKEYIKVIDAQRKAKDTIDLINKHPPNYRIINIGSINMEDSNFYKIVPIEYKYSLLIYKNKINKPADVDITVDLIPNSRKNLLFNIIEYEPILYASAKSFETHIADVFDFLTKIFYYYPKMEIYNWKMEKLM